MNEIVAFSFQASEQSPVDVRSICNERGDPWFVLRDLLEAMGSTTTTTNALESVKQGLGDGYSSELPIVDGLGRNQKVAIVSEAAATYLVARSNTEQGRALNKFIHTEVLPSIRKTGQYSKKLTPAELILAQAQQLVDLEREQARQAEIQRQLEMRQASTERRLDQIETATDHFTIVGWHRYSQQSGSLPIADAARMGKQATLFCKQHDVEMGSVPDPRFGTVNTYPKWVLNELFAGQAH